MLLEAVYAENSIERFGTLLRMEQTLTSSAATRFGLFRIILIFIGRYYDLW
jgi:hypothetical protein